MFKISKVDFHSQILISIVAFLLLWIPALINVSPFVFIPYSLFGFCFGWIQYFPIGGVLLTIILLILGVLILYKTLVDKHLQSSNTFYPEIILLIFASGVSFGQLTPETVSMFFLILALQPLYNIGEETFNDNAIFLSSLLFGIAILFHPVLWICCLVPIIAIVIFTSLSVRKLALSLLGTIYPWICYFAVLFLTDSLAPAFSVLKQQASLSFLGFEFPLHWLSLSFLILELVMMIPIVIIVVSHSQKDLVINRRRIIITMVLYFLLIICELSMNNYGAHALLLHLPETILIIYLYEHLRKVKMVGIGILILFLLQMTGRWMLLF